MKKIVSLFLSFSLILSLTTTAFATNVTTNGGSQNVPVELTQDSTTFSVTVPTVLPVSVGGMGEVTVSTNNKIVNNSFGPVEVKSVKVDPQNDWELFAFNTDFKQLKVGSKSFGFQINGMNVNTSGNCLANFDIIEGNSEISFTYDAKIAPQNREISRESIANVIFTVGWYTGGSSGGAGDIGEDGDETHVSTPTHVYYRIGSGETLSVTFDAPFGEFKRVKVNGEKLVLNQDYSISKDGSGNATVTFTESYIRSIEEGDYEVMLVAQDGYALADLTTIYTNTLNLTTTTPGYISEDGTMNTTTTTLTYTSKIPVKAGDTLDFYYFTTVASPNAARFVTAYDANGNVVTSEGKASVKEYIVPEGITHVVVTLSTGSIDQMMIIKNTDNVPTRYIPFNGDDAGAVNLGAFVNVLDLTDLTPGYVGANGVINSGTTTLAHTRRIAVNEGDKFILWTFTTQGAFKNSMRFVTAYDANGKPIESVGSSSGTNTYIVPAGVASLVFTVQAESANQSIILKNTNVTPPCFIAYNGNNITMDIPIGVGFVNLFDKDNVTSGYLSLGGGANSSSSLCYNTKKIAVEPGDVLYFWKGSTAYGVRFITAYDENGAAVSASGDSTGSAQTYTVPEGIYSVVITIYTSALDSFMVFKNETGTPPTYIPYTGEVVETPSEPEIPDVINYFDKTAITDGKYMAHSGGVSVASSLCYSEKIYVTPGETLSFWKGTTAYGVRFITAFDADGNVLGSLGSNSGSDTTYTVPNNVDSVIISIYNSALDTFMVLKDLEGKPTEYIEYNESYIPARPEKPAEPEVSYDFSGEEWLYTTGDMTSATKLSVGKADVITDKHLVFIADITSFDGIRLGHGYNDYTSAYIEIDNTSIKQYQYTSDTTLLKEEAHGLDISGKITVTIDVNQRRVATVKVQSNGKSYTFNSGTNWYGSNGEIYAQSLGSVLPNAQLAWTCDGYSKDIQFYGDSYLSQSSDRWLYFAFQSGYKDALFDGFGGRGSGGAYTSLVENLKHSNPKTVVWLMGMNDGSDPDANTPSSSWTTNRDKLIALSQEYGFEIVFATIPTVPNIYHEGKNNWIRNSGYRYIDIAEALGADGTGAWTEGYLSTDNVHPTAAGSQAIYNAVITDFPDFIK